MNPPLLLAVTGATGAGKTALAEEVAARTGALLISADAFQVYRGFDIGTSKPEDPGRWSLVDVCDPSDGFGVGEFIRMALPLLDQAWKDGRDAVVAGGTGLYVRALFEEYADMQGPPDEGLRRSLANLPLEELLSRLDALCPGLDIDRRNPVRVRRSLEKAMAPKAFPPFALPPFRQVKVGLDRPHAELSASLEARLDLMIRRGWEEETRLLLEQGVPPQAPAMRAIGYQAWQRVLQGSLTRSEARDRILIETRQYAKRQRSWLRSEPRLAWKTAPQNHDEVLVLADGILNG